MNCIRGCTRRTLNDDGEEVSMPKEATDGYLDAKCAGELLGRLTDIPDLYAQLDPRLGSASGQGGNRKTKISGSPALVRLEVLALMDPRTEADEPCPEDCLLDHEHTDSYVHVISDIQGWAMILTEMRGLTSPIDTLTGAVQLLTAWFGTVCAAPWVDEMYTDVQRVHSTLWRLTDQPKPDAWCFGQDPAVGCGAPLYYERNPKYDPHDPDTSQQILRCPRKGCHRVYRTATDLVRVAIQADHERRKRA